MQIFPDSSKFFNTFVRQGLFVQIFDKFVKKVIFRLL